MGLKNKLGKIKKIILPKPEIKVNVTVSGGDRKLEGKYVLITGGATGIGKAVAKKVVRENGKAIIVGRREEALISACKEIGEDNCRYLVQDTTKLTDYRSFFQRASELFGGGYSISALVCNAGIYIEPKNLYEFEADDFDKIIAVNLKAPMLEIMNYVRYCEQNHLPGNIVVTASNRGLFGDHGPYGVSKRGIIHYVQGMARDCIGKGVRINAVAPGMTVSEITRRDVNGDLYTDNARNHRVLLPDEIAEVIGFLLSNESKCVAGAVIPCDEADFLR